MLKVELKRILKTRSTWWLFVIAFILCLFFGSYAVYRNYHDENQYDMITDKIIKKGEIIRGTEAYEITKERYAPIKGEITPELISEAVRVQRDLIDQYGSDYRIPTEISNEKLGPYSPIYTWLLRAFTDENGMMMEAVSPEQALNFYQERLLTLERQLESDYRQQPQVVDYAMSRADTGKNFNYSYGVGSTYTFDHLGTCIFIVIFICLIITAPIFASDYASGADDILRCSRYGRKRLALVKLSSAIIISLSIFALCIGAFLLIIYFTHGFDDITSLELLNISYNPNGLNALDCMGVIILAGLLTLLAMSCFTLFLSSSFKSPLVVLAISIVVALIPTVLWITGLEGNVFNWLRFILPSGGVLFSTSSVLQEFGSLRFLWAGDFVTWSPYVILVATAVQIPLWFGLSLYSYDKHQAA